MLNEFTKRLQGLSRRQRVVGATLAVLIGAAAFGYTQFSSSTRGHSDVSSQSRKGGTRYMLTPAEWASVSVQPVIEKPFRAEHVTGGDAEQQRVADLPAGAGDRDSRGLCHHALSLLPCQGSSPEEGARGTVSA